MEPIESYLKAASSAQPGKVGEETAVPPHIVGIDIAPPFCRLLLLHALAEHFNDGVKLTAGEVGKKFQILAVELRRITKGTRNGGECTHDAQSRYLNKIHV